MDAEARRKWSTHRPTPSNEEFGACVAPWVSMEFDPSGWVYACCASGLYPLGRIGVDRLADLWEGPRAAVLREALSRWDLTVACGACRWHLEHGRYDPVAAVYDEYPVGSAMPHVMVFALSNRCNLGCVMCSPDLSTTLRSQAGMAPLPPRYDDRFFEDLAPFLRELKLAKFLGGEPFLAPEHRRVWSMLGELDTPPHLQVTTNGTVWTDQVEWLLERFTVDISISVDAATAETYADVRRHGDHAVLMENIERFEEACRRRGTKLHVSYCLMDRNEHELADFLVWADRFELPASINLVTDDGLALHDLDLEVLLEVRSRWEGDELRVGERLGKNGPVWQTQRSQLDAVIAERQAGIGPAPRHAQPAPPDLFWALPAPLPPRPYLRRRGRADKVRLERERQLLEDWSGGGPVAILRLGPDGNIQAVEAPHGALGVDRGLVGTSVRDLLGVLEDARSAPPWIIELATGEDRIVRTLILARERPARGSSGVIVRTVHIPRTLGSWILLAEDLTYHESPTKGVPVALGARGR